MKKCIAFPLIFLPLPKSKSPPPFPPPPPSVSCVWGRERGPWARLQFRGSFQRGGGGGVGEGFAKIFIFDLVKGNLLGFRNVQIKIVSHSSLANPAPKKKDAPSPPLPPRCCWVKETRRGGSETERLSPFPLLLPFIATLYFPPKCSSSSSLQKVKSRRQSGPTTHFSVAQILFLSERNSLSSFPFSLKEVWKHFPLPLIFSQGEGGFYATSSSSSSSSSSFSRRDRKDRREERKISPFLLLLLLRFPKHII